MKIRRATGALGQAARLASGTALVAVLSSHSSPVAAATYEVGPGKRYPAISRVPSLRPGDVVLIHSGTYNEVKRWRTAGTVAAPIIVRGVGPTRPVVDATGLTVDGRLPNPRAAFQVEASNVVIENLEFRNARNGNNGAGIRVTTYRDTTINTLVRNCRITYCDMGVMCDGNDGLLIESCEIAYNGTELYSGYSHNLYLGGGRTTIRFCYIHDSLYGQNVKSRGHYTQLLYNYIADSRDGEIGLVDGAETARSNSNAVMIGNIVVSKDRGAGWNRNRFIQFGQDMGRAHRGTLYAINNTLVAGTPGIVFLDTNANGSAIVAVNNVFYGSRRVVGTTSWTRQEHVSSGNGPVSGSANWMPAGAAAPSGFTGTVTGRDPGFVDAKGRDYRLTPVSACRGIGSNTPTYIDGDGVSRTGVPAFEYVNHLRRVARASDGRLDAGTDEHGRARPADGVASGEGARRESAWGAATRLLRSSSGGGGARAQPKAGALEGWEAKLLARVKEELAAGRPVRLTLSSLQQQFEVLSVDAASVRVVGTTTWTRLRREDGSPRGGDNDVDPTGTRGGDNDVDPTAPGILRLKGKDTEVDVEWSRLTTRDKSSLALSLLREASPEDHCLVAFYMLASGDEAGAEKHLGRGGEGAVRVQDSFASSSEEETEPEGEAGKPGGPRERRSVPRSVRRPTRHAAQRRDLQVLPGIAAEKATARGAHQELLDEEFAKLYREAETCFVEDELDRARELFERIAREYPESDYARKAKEYLQILAQ